MRWGVRAALPSGALLRSGILFFLLLAAALPVLAGSIHELAAAGDKAYRDGDFKKAIASYTRVLGSGYVSGPLLYNLGNAEFKAGHNAEAILYYERAAKLMPHNKDLRYNLELARSRTVDRIDAPPRLPIWNTLDAIRDLVAPRTLSIAAWLLALLAATVWSVSMILRKPALRKSARTTSLVLAGLFVLALAFVALRIAADHGAPAAIVMAEEVSLHSAPDPTSLEVLSLHAGTKVTVVKELNNWREVRLADGRQGWMPAESCTTI